MVDRLEWRPGRRLLPAAAAIALLASNLLAGTWVSASGNLSVSNLNKVVAVPNTDRMIAGLHCFGMWGSTNAGQSWTKLGGAAADNITNGTMDIIFDPIDPNTFWEVGIYGGANCTGWGPGVFQTTDGGNTFIAVGGLAHNDGFTVDFTDPQRLTQLATGHETPQKIYKSVNGGVSFIEIGANLPAGTSVTSAIHAITSQVYVVSVGGYGSGTEGIFRTTDGGTSWTNAGPGLVSTWGCPFGVISTGELYLINRSGGIIRGSADGSSWTTISCGARGTHPPVELPGGKIGVVSSSGVLVSSDKGDTWQSCAGNLPVSDASGLAYNSVGGAFYAFKGGSGVWRYDTMLAAGLNIYALRTDPVSITNDAATSVTFTVHAANSGGSVSSVTIDLSSVGGGAAVAMTAGAGDLYTCAAGVGAGIEPGIKTITATVTDGQGGMKTTSGAITVTPPTGELHYMALYADTCALNTTFGWYGNGAGNGEAATGCSATEISTGAYEGTNCLDFGFAVVGWWAGFGIVWDAWNYVLDATGYDSIGFYYKTGTDVTFKIELELPNSSSTTAAAMTLSGTGDWAHVAIPFSFYTSAGYDIDSIIEMNFIITGSSASTPSGHIYLDNFYVVGSGNVTVLVPDAPGRTARHGTTVDALHGGETAFDLRGRRMSTLPVRHQGWPGQGLVVVRSADGRVRAGLSGQR